jgi:transposase-like protein
MAPIDLALDELMQCDTPNVAEVARRHGVPRATLYRRFAKGTGSLAEKAENQSLLSH